MKNLPQFKARKYEIVLAFASEVVTNREKSEDSFLRKLDAFSDGHYRLVFDVGYFASGNPPSKSQWNSLKKKLKRHDKNVFVFKETGLTTADEGYIDFGFFAESR